MNYLFRCGRSKKCSKDSGHEGKCDSKREINKFWEKSPIYRGYKIRQDEAAITVKEHELLALQKDTEDSAKKSCEFLQFLFVNEWLMYVFMHSFSKKEKNTCIN